MLCFVFYTHLAIKIQQQAERIHSMMERKGEGKPAKNHHLTTEPTPITKAHDSAVAPVKCEPEREQ